MILEFNKLEDPPIVNSYSIKITLRGRVVKKPAVPMPGSSNNVDLSVKIVIHTP